ncbi:MAG: TerB family tellurite resistance protein [Micropepsaceae bacterium]
MFDKIKALLTQGGLKSESAAFSERDIAVAALLLEAADTDGAHTDDEHAALRDLVVRRLGHTPGKALQLLEAARVRQREAVELFRFTDAARRSMDENERGGLVEMLWEVVYADGVLDPFEDRLIRSVAALLHVPDRMRAEGRQRVLARRAAASQ